MPEYIILPEPLLKVGHYIHFSKGWKKPELEDKFFKIVVTQQIPVYIWRIIESGKSVDIVLEDEGLYPEDPESFYEIAFKMKGENCILYPRLPSTDYYNKLEKSGFVPDLADDNKRYIGGYTEEDFKEGILKEYTVNKDWQSDIVYRIYNDSPEDEHVVLRTTVNRCQIKEVIGKEREDVLRTGRYKEILHYTMVKMGWRE
jgi:hypothetical protein